MVARLCAARGWTIDGECMHVWVRMDSATDAAGSAVWSLPRPRRSTEEASHSD
jgi:hypothetical protein